MIEVCGQSTVIVGFEDGSLHLYDIDKKFGKNYTLQKATNLYSPYDEFFESNYEHSDAIVGLAARQTEAGMEVLTASREGLLIIWKVGTDDQDDMLHFSADFQLEKTITNAVFTGMGQIAVSTNEGELLTIQVGTDSQNVMSLQHPKAVSQWDSSILDMVAFSQSELLLALDSGKIAHCDLQTGQMRALAVSSL